MSAELPFALTPHFSYSYQTARAKFLAAAQAAGLAVQSHLHPLRGRDGEELALDVVLDGDAQADKLLIISSACHGVEGFCGSGVQIAALHDSAWRAQARASGVAVLYLHALNPHGFSFWRRVTEDNVDLNRNFHDFTQALPVNSAYRDVHALLFPATWPPLETDNQAMFAYVAQHGMPAFQAAVSGGQHEFADGLFYGGVNETWSNRTLRHILREYGQHAQHIAWVDLHTGLGPEGVGERIFAGRDDAQELARAQRWWGNDGATPVTSIYDGSSSSAKLSGMMWSAIYTECPQAQYTGIAMEYGTQSLLQVLNGLRGDHWLQMHPEATPELAARIKADMFAAYFVDSDAWREAIYRQARQSFSQAVTGLSTSQ